MSTSILFFVSALFIGIGATLTFDLWALFLKYAFKVTPSNFCLVGRWIRYMPEGTFRHSDIGSSPQRSGECLVGWIAHYTIGVVFAIVFISLLGKDWLQHPILFPAMIFGVVTVSAPFFIMQPLLGLGFAASKMPRPMQSRLRTLMNHTAFGFGIYLSGLLVNWLFRIFA